ncbi:MAG: hypothetical protein R3362_03890 [Rhodothermales bacterium]|nr:hypothetical protein [Rhodothermales bacterium]
MPLRTNTFDLWVFSRARGEPRYLLFYASQEKADRYFNGGRFWQLVPGCLVRDGETLRGALDRVLTGLRLDVVGVWAAEYTYTIYNLKRESVEVIPVFAAEVAAARGVPLPEGVSEQAWLSASACEERLVFRGLKEGLRCVREYVSEVGEPHPALRLTG